MVQDLAKELHKLTRINLARWHIEIPEKSILAKRFKTF